MVNVILGSIASGKTKYVETELSKRFNTGKTVIFYPDIKRSNGYDRALHMAYPTDAHGLADLHLETSRLSGFDTWIFEEAQLIRMFQNHQEVENAILNEAESSKNIYVVCQYIDSVPFLEKHFPSAKLIKKLDLGAEVYQLDAILKN